MKSGSLFITGTGSGTTSAFSVEDVTNNQIFKIQDNSRLTLTNSAIGVALDINGAITTTTANLLNLNSGTNNNIQAHLRSDGSATQPTLNFWAGTSFGNTLEIRGSNRPAITSVNSGQLSVVTSVGTAFANNASVTPGGMVHIKGIGTGSAKGLRIEDSVASENFFVRDDGVVSATDGYSINSQLFLHATKSGIPGDQASGNVFVGRLAGLNNTAFNNVGIGNGAFAANTSGTGVAIGQGALNKNTTGGANVAIGNNTLGVLVGANGSNTGIGHGVLNTLTAGGTNTALGTSAGNNLTGGSFNSFLGAVSGADVSGSYSSSIALGYGSKITASNQMVIGTQASGAWINDFYLGAGVEQTTIAPTKFNFRMTNIEAGQINTTSGYDFVLNGSQGTGTGLGGDIIFRTAPAGVSGSTQNALVDALNITQDGVVVFKSFTVSTLPTAVAGGMIRVSNETGGDTLAYSDGTNWRRVSDGAIVS